MNGQTKGGGGQAATTPNWVDDALSLASNGTVGRVAIPVELDDLLAGDIFAGPIVRLGKATLTLAIEYGLMDGKELEVGEWRTLRYGHVRVIKNWIEHAGIEIGDRVVLRYRGRVGNKQKPWHGFDCVKVDRESTAGAPWE